MLRHRKRPTVMPEGASYGTARACADIQTSERPIGRTPKLGAEPQVWPARMLTALDRGVKGGKWDSLIDKGYPESALRSASTQAPANPRRAAGGALTRHTHAIDPPRRLPRPRDAAPRGHIRRR